jgi:ribosomal protein S18 acetylase RimI-like enzyme
MFWCNNATDVEAGYARWFKKELANPKALILGALLDDVMVGYAYARLEGKDWNALLDEHAALHDLYVAEAARRRGVARALLEHVLRELRARGVAQVVLSTAVRNLGAQRLFEASGFRPTMLEMACQLG